jgi:hypothetical protein
MDEVCSRNHPSMGNTGTQRRISCMRQFYRICDLSAPSRGQNKWCRNLRSPTGTHRHSGRNEFAFQNFRDDEDELHFPLMREASRNDQKNCKRSRLR